MEYFPHGVTSLASELRYTVMGKMPGFEDLV